jgi:hypothetical protein
LAQTVIVIPSARRLMESLRDIGYEPPSAIADLIDNSIDAHATRVAITVEFAGEDSWIRVADNGTGMPAARLNEAMRYGSERDYGERDLGRFGLGLKTASLSQCSRLTVATRTNPERREIEIRRWDLEHVRDKDRWELIRLSPRDVQPEVVEPLADTTGSVVLWERLDRALAYRNREGLAAENGFGRLCREIERHIGMVFHRFLAGEARRSLPLSVTLNGNPVDAWDPFAGREPHAQRLERQLLTLRDGGRLHTIVVQPHILPAQMQFSTPRAWEEAGGPNRWLRQQGLYIYRGGRLIQSGGWSHLRTLDEHTKLARIEVDIPAAADAAFAINVSKMRVTLPPGLRDDLRAIATAVAGRADRAYRRVPEPAARPPRRAGAPSPAPSPARPVSGRPPGPPAQPGEPSGDSGDLVLWRLVRDVLTRELGGQPEVLRRILAAIRDARGAETETRSGAGARA